MTQRVLTFREEQCKYLLLNIIAHDVIHDYGNADSDRWAGVQKILKDFYQPGISGGGPETKTVTKTVTKSAKPSVFKPSVFKSALKTVKKEKNEEDDEEPYTPTVLGPYGQQISSVFGFGEGQGRVTGTSIKSLDEFCIEPELQSFIDGIENEITMAFFHILLTQKTWTLIDYVLFISYIPRILNEIERANTDIDNIYADIQDVILYALNNNQILIENENIRSDRIISNYADINFIFKVVAAFFANNRQDIKTIIYSYVNFDYNARENNGMSFGGKLQTGGLPRETLAIENAIPLYNSVQPYLITDPATNPIYQKIEQMNIHYQTIQNTDNEPDVNLNRNEYNKIRKSIIDELRGIFIQNNAEKYAKCLEQIKILGDRNVRNLNVAVDIVTVIRSSIEVPGKIAQKAIAAEAEKQKQIADDIRRAQSGSLTSQDKTLVGNFMKLIAKLGLRLTGCINADDVSPGFTDPTLITELQTLRYIAGLSSTIRTKDLDTTLINHFEAEYNYKQGEKISERINCPRIGKYIINNAAPIGSMSKLAFCPYTSVIDGMSQCSWGSANGDGIERGNMNFLINGAQDGLSYNGALTIRSDSDKDEYENPTQVSINFVVNCPGYGQIIGNKPLVDVSKADDLQACVVLKKTLLAILSINGIPPQNIFSVIEKNFQNLIPDPLSGVGAQIPIFALIYREILFKGVGDLFQEINSVAKFGGYTGENYFSAQGVLGYTNPNGNQIRCFLANDRPSGTRFIYMLLNGSAEQINTKAFGGYYSKEKEVLAKRSDNTDVCSAVRGGKRRKKTRKRTKRNKKHSRRLKL